MRLGADLQYRNSTGHCAVSISFYLTQLQNNFSSCHHQKYSDESSTVVRCVSNAQVEEEDRAEDDFGLECSECG